jgi:hypothetical protein
VPSIVAIEIPLTQNMSALIDDEDYELINQYTWYACKYAKTFYAKRNIRIGYCHYTTQYMHTLIMQAKRIDHINLNGLDNRRQNLRVTTVSANIQNSASRGGTSKYKGVHFATGEQKWKAEIMINRKGKFLGYFDNEMEAALAYDVAARFYYGNQAYLNFG